MGGWEAEGACAWAADAQTVQDPAGTGSQCHLGAVFQPLSAALSPSCQLQAQPNFLSALLHTQLRLCVSRDSDALPMAFTGSVVFLEAYCIYPGQPGLSLRSCALRLERNHNTSALTGLLVTVVRQSEGGNPPLPWALAAE